MGFYLAVDAGGTKADYLLADETRTLARVRSGTIKRMRTDAATAAGHLAAALEQLTTVAGIPMTAVTRTCIGTAGESVPLVTDWLRSEFGARVSGELLLLGDVEIALDAAFPGEAGVLVLAGTGSNVAGRSSNGRLTSAGGWGPALADQGSGHRIGLQALRAMFLALDQDRPTSLFEAVLDHWNLASVESLVGFANRIPPPDFSTLTEIVVTCAAEGDSIAAEVLDRESRELAYLVSLVIGRLRRDEPDLLPSVAFAGTILEKVAAVRDGLMNALRSEYPAIAEVPGVVDPVIGALWRARRVS